MRLFHAVLRYFVVCFLGLTAIGFATQAAAQSKERWDLCAEQYARDQSDPKRSLGISRSDAEVMIRNIASSIGLNASSVAIVPCYRVGRAQTVLLDDSMTGVPAGEYMFFNEQWVREVVGSDRFQAIALFGHELGHLLNRDFLPPRSLQPRSQLETDADEFAGCAVAAAGGSLENVERLFSRLRATEDTLYPNRLQSTEAAKRGYDRCIKAPPPSTASGPNMPPRQYKTLQAFRDCDNCPILMPLPAGDFLMGSAASDVGSLNNEYPQHKVNIKEFAIGQFEITFDDWMECQLDGMCADTTPNNSGFGGGKRPVMNVSWDAAQKYIHWLSEKTGRNYRLPTEAEWEYAAREGGQLRTYYWKGSDQDACKVGNLYDSQSRAQMGWDRAFLSCTDGFAGTAPVGSYPASAWKLYDMFGNISEWVQDCYVDSYKDAPSDGSAIEYANCPQRGVRGGSWWGRPDWVRIGLRDFDRQGYGDRGMGFRVASDLKEPVPKK